MVDFYTSCFNGNSNEHSTEELQNLQLHLNCRQLQQCYLQFEILSPTISCSMFDQVVGHNFYRKLSNVRRFRFSLGNSVISLLAENLLDQNFIFKLKIFHIIALLLVTLHINQLHEVNIVL